MWMRTIRWTVLVGVAVVLMASHAWALDEILGQTKEELKLKYDVSVRDLGNGRVFVFFTITDAGRLSPLRSIELQIPGRDKDKEGRYPPDLALSLATRKTDGGEQTGLELTKKLAGRAEIWLTAAQLDGKQMPLTGYVYRIPLAHFMKNALAAPAAPAPRTEPGGAPPAAPAPAASERKN